MTERIPWYIICWAGDGVAYCFDQVNPKDGIFFEGLRDNARAWLKQHLPYCEDNEARHDLVPGADPYEMNGI